MPAQGLEHLSAVWESWSNPLLHTGAACMTSGESLSLSFAMAPHL